MVVALKCVAIGQASCFLERHAAAAISAHSVLVLDRHYLLRKVAFIHVKVEAVHRDKLCESDVVGLPVVVRQRVTEHKHAFL